MSMPHECTCRVCGGLMSQPPLILPPIGIVAESEARGAKTLATAIMNFAPDLAKELADRWLAAKEGEAQALDDFLKVLRREPNSRDAP